MVSASIQREWSANIAARRAEPRIANLLCNLLARATLLGAAQNQRIDCPLTQVDLANACGVTQEHLNRSLRRLRERRLVEIQPGTIVIHDPDALAEIAGFSPTHLHCGSGAIPFMTKMETHAPDNAAMTLSASI